MGAREGASDSEVPVEDPAEVRSFHVSWYPAGGLEASPVSIVRVRLYDAAPAAKYFRWCIQLHRGPKADTNDAVFVAQAMLAWNRRGPAAVAARVAEALSTGARII
jgi:hypothetical protein